MSELRLILAVEDAVTEALLNALLHQSGRHYQIVSCLCERGFGFLRKNSHKFNQVARSTPVLLLTDLDNPQRCPLAMIRDWLSPPQHPNFLLRIAVVTIESWVLADREAIAHWLGIAVHKIPHNTDTIPHPKQFLIDLARKCRSRTLRTDLAPPTGATSPQITIG